MERKIILVVLLTFAAAITSRAQQTKVEDYTPSGFDDLRYNFGSGAKKITTVSQDGRLNRVVTVEYKTKKGDLRRKIEWRKDLRNHWTRFDTCFNDRGKATNFTEFTLDENNKLVVFRMDRWADTFKRNAAGQMQNDKGSTAAEAIVDVYKDMMIRELPEIEKELPSLPDSPPPCALQQSCIPKAQIFGGYSYLNADFGSKRESFPLGAQVSLVVNLTPHIGLGPDISIHTKTIDDQTITRMFFLAKGQYNFGSDNNPNDTAYRPDFSSDNTCTGKIVPDFHIYIGLSTERSVIKIGDEKFTSSGSGFTFGAGIGVHFNLSKSISLGVQADYLGTKFKDSDEINSDVRGSAGLFFNMGNLSHELKFGR
jgi:hypothetical protein